MDTYTLTEKIEELQKFLDFINERDKQLWERYLIKCTQLNNDQNYENNYKQYLTSKRF